MTTLINSKILRIVVRFFGVLTGLLLLGFALVALLPFEGSFLETKDTFGIFWGLIFAIIAICLFIPYRIFKKAETALWFFRTFLLVSLTYILSFTSGSVSLIIGLAIIILANVWISYFHYRQLLTPNL